MFFFHTVGVLACEMVLLGVGSILQHKVCWEAESDGIVLLMICIRL